MNNEFILVIFIILLGFLVKTLNIITEKDGESLAKLVFNLTLPAMIIYTFSTVTIDRSLSLLPVISIGHSFIILLAAFIIFRKEPQRIKGMLMMPLLGLNIGLFAYPLVEALWGIEVIKYYGMFDMGNAFVIFVLCYVIGAYFSSPEASIDYRAILKKTFRSIPLVAYIITLLLNVTNTGYPLFIIDISEVIARANMPLSLLVLGIYLNFSFKKDHYKKMSAVLAVKYTIGLILGITLYYLLPFEPYFRLTVLVCLILPSSLSIIPYSVQFEYDTKFIGTLSNFTIVISIILMLIISIITTILPVQ